MRIQQLHAIAGSDPDTVIQAVRYPVIDTEPCANKGADPFSDRHADPSADDHESDRLSDGHPEPNRLW